MTSIRYLRWSCSVTTGYWRIARYEYVQSQSAAFIIFSIIVWLRGPAYLTNTEAAEYVYTSICYSRYFVVGISHSQYDCRERTCYPLHTQTHADMICLGHMCLQCICEDNQVFNQGFVSRIKSFWMNLQNGSIWCWSYDQMSNIFFVAEIKKK